MVGGNDSAENRERKNTLKKTRGRRTHIRRPRRIMTSSSVGVQRRGGPSHEWRSRTGLVGRYGRQLRPEETHHKANGVPEVDKRTPNV